MNFEWLVKVKDKDGKPLADAEVALAAKSALGAAEYPFAAAAATHAHDANGLYKPSAALAPAAGNWVLIVRRKGSSPAVQPLTMSDRGGDFSLAIKGGAVATVKLVSAVHGKDAARARKTVLSATLFPAAEVVALSGTDYPSSGVEFRQFADGHARALLREKKIDAGTMVTLFSCDERARISLAFTAAGKLVTLGKHSFGDATGLKAGRVHPPVAGNDISAPDLYRYLDAVGTSDPGRVREVSFFTHSWPGGPILFDTSEDAAHETSAERDPNDFDGRAKDFGPPNSDDWKKLKDALAPGATWHVWGCSATTFFKDLMREALKTARADHFFDTITEVKQHDGTLIMRSQARLTRVHVRFMMDQKMRTGSYLATAASTLKIPVFGAPPGVGADYQQVDGLQVMSIKGNTPPYAFFKADFSPGFAPTLGKFDHGYIDYGKLQDRAAMPRAPFSTEAYLFDVALTAGTATLRLGSAHQPPRHAGSSVKLKVAAKAGLVTAGKSGHLYLIEDRDPAKSEAFFLQDDKKLFAVGKDGAGKFTVPGAEL